MGGSDLKVYRSVDCDTGGSEERSTNTDPKK